MGSDGRLADAALEVLNGNDRWHVERRAGRGGAQHFAHVEHFLGRVAEPPSVLAGGGRGQPTVFFRHADAVGRATEQLGRLRNTEADIESFPAFRQKGLAPQPLDHALAALRKIGDLGND